MKKRSECPFPFSGNYCASFIENAWYCGWLNDYSNEHFLIKAINNQLTRIEWEQQLLCNNVYSSSTTISSNGKVDYKKFSLNFVINLSMKLSAMNITFGENKIKKFIEDQLSAGKSSYDNDKFFQALSEIEILSFYCRQTGGNKATYEPPIGMNGANPEAQFIIRDSLTATNVTVNVEVKTPKFPAAIKNREKILIPTILLSDLRNKKYVDAGTLPGFIFSKSKSASKFCNHCS